MWNFLGKLVRKKVLQEGKYDIIINIVMGENNDILFGKNRSKVVV